MSEQPFNNAEQPPVTSGDTEGFSIEALHEETRRRKAAQAKEREKTSEAVREFYRNFARKDKLSRSSQEADEAAKDASATEETETVYEQAPISIETGLITIGIHSRRKPLNEDTVLCDEKLRLYGVFDGMGGYDNGHIISPSAAQGVRRYYTRKQTPPESVEEALSRAQGAMAAGRAAVVRSGRVGGTTAVFGKVEQIAGRHYFIWGNAGDSRLFMQEHPDAVVTPVSTDQSYGRYVLNGLYTHPDMRRSMDDEFGALLLTPDNRLVMCSDGITGDTLEQQLTDQEMQWAFQAPHPQEVAERLVTVSKKQDDKSVIALDIHKADKEPPPTPKKGERATFPRPVIFPSMRSMQQEMGLRQRMRQQWLRAKEALRSASVRGMTAIGGYSGYRQVRDDPESSETDKTRRRALIAGAVGVVALYTAYKFGLFDSIFGGGSPEQPGIKTGPSPDTNIQPPAGVAPESVQPPKQPSPAPAPEMQPANIRLAPGDTIWDRSAEYLQAHGYPATDVNIDIVKDAVLERYGITEEMATRLPVGFRFTIPPDILEELHK